MNDFDKGFMMGMAMGGDDDSPQSQNGGCFTNIFMTLVYGGLFFIGAVIIVLLLIALTGFL